MIILGIETSCDETAIAIVKDGQQILCNCISSQIDLHTQYGGVVPELASRGHVKTIFPLLEYALDQAQLNIEQIDAIAATYTPGLIGALLVGLTTAKSLALALKIPFIGVHHIEAHLYSAWMSQDERTLLACLPALGLVISGGHTLVCYIKELGNYQILSHTLDDALGEAFDKVAVMLGYAYPGGPYIEQLAKQGDPKAFAFKAGYSKIYPWHFSFSGLKTQVLHALWGPHLTQLASSREPAGIDQKTKENLAASFQHTAIEDLFAKVSHFCHQLSPQSVWVGGGVSANQALRKRFEDLPMPTLWPSKLLSIDNAAMIAGLGYHKYKKVGSNSLTLLPQARCELECWSQ